MANSIWRDTPHHVIKEMQIKAMSYDYTSEYSSERLIQKLKHQYFGHLMRRTDSLEKTLMRGKIEGRRRRGRQRMRWLAHEFEQALGVGRWTGRPVVLPSMGLQRVEQDWETELNWTVCRRSQGHKESDTTERLSVCSLKSLQITNAGVDVEKRNPPTLLVWI